MKSVHPSKRAIGLILCAILLLGMVGCQGGGTPASAASSSAAPSGASASASSAASAAAPKHKDELIIANAIDITSADKMENSTVIGNQMWDMIFDGLTTRDPKTNKIELRLAESYEQVSDTEYLFKLRKGIKFHNGDEFTSKDVKHTYERQVTMPAAASYAANIEELICEDDYTVRYKLKQASAIFLEHLAQTCATIESKKAYDDNGGKFSPVGTGPYKFVEWVPSDHITVEKFDGCWDPGAVTKRITMRIIPEGAARVIALETGDIDIALEPPTIDLGHIKDNKDCKLLQVSACKLDYFSFNSQKVPFNNPKVRLAMAMAVNKQEIIDAVLEGLGRPANNVVGYNTLTYSDDLTPIEYNVEKAKALMAEAGYPKGFAMTVTLNGDTRERVAQVLQAQFAELGVELTINNWDNATHRQHINSGQFESSVSAWSNPGDPDIILRNLFHSSMVGVNNRTWLADPAIDEKIDGLVREMDEKKRIAGYKELQQELLNTCVMIPVYYETLSIGTRKNVDGLYLNSGGAHWYKYAYALT